MRSTFARLAKTVIVLWMAMWMTAGGQVALAQDGLAQDIDEEAEVERVVIDLVRAEANGDIHLLYDYMLPESRDLVPRQAFVTWYAEQGFPVPTGAPEIDSITFDDVEYELTGTDYENVAFVEFTVPTADGEESRELRLWSDDVTWRWFLDVPEDVADEIIQGAVFTVEYNSLYQTELYQQLDMFWAQVFADHGVPYRSPIDLVGLNVFPVETGCGVMEESDIRNNAVYCGFDETMYYDPIFRQQVIDEHGPYAWEFAIAHEWAHHIQNVLGYFRSADPELYGGAYTIEHELQADCIAAVFTQDLFSRGIIRNRDVRSAQSIMPTLGDSAGTQWDKEGAHGNGEQRLEAFWIGYEDGLRGCYVNFDRASN
jgi:predicted metalloprotease